MDSRISIKDNKNVVIFKVEGDFDNLLCIKQIKKTLAISGIALIIDTYEDIYENIKESITSYE